jgi:hypothetical protein
MKTPLALFILIDRCSSELHPNLCPNAKQAKGHEGSLINFMPVLERGANINIKMEQRGRLGENAGRPSRPPARKY